jgi:hypothetical protein
MRQRRRREASPEQREETAEPAGLAEARTDVTRIQSA